MTESGVQAPLPVVGGGRLCGELKRWNAFHEERPHDAFRQLEIEESKLLKRRDIMSDRFNR